MAAYFDPTSWSPLRAIDIGRRLFEQSWLEQWLTTTAAWMDPVVDLGSGTVTALLPDVLMTVLSEGILSRFGGQEITVTLVGHELHATLQVLKVRRRGAHFQTKTVLSRLRWDDHPLETVTVIAHGVRLIPGVPSRVRTARLEVSGTVTLAALVAWLNTLPLAWHLEVTAEGDVRARHRRHALTALVDGAVTDNRLTLRVRRARWRGIPLPRRLVDQPVLPLRDLPRDLRIVCAALDGDLVRFELELPETTASFDLAQIRDAVVAGTTLIVF
ncbi:hypothetical protein [Nocardia farcinica]|uniref:hypothetical protein n=1 Tax=Nocardia farcinica TaxID=37329 RepID=UPI00245876DC|nr:hypothetical protein [Nocardia farcinica]